MSAVEVNAGEWKRFSASDEERPFVMLNLLKFKGDEGKASYFRYMKEANRFVEAVGAKVLFLGQPVALLTGKETWDLVMLVRYPSRRAFFQMANDPEYLKVHKYREEGLERAVLYAMDEITARNLLSQGGK